MSSPTPGEPSEGPPVPHGTPAAASPSGGPAPAANLVATGQAPPTSLRRLELWLAGGPDEEWSLSRPPLVLERLGRVFAGCLGKGAVALLALALLLLVVVGIPSISVARSAAWRAAREFVLSRPEVELEIGSVVRFELVPTRYAVTRDETRFTFWVQGEVARGAADVTLRRETPAGSATAPGEVWRVTSASFVAERVGVSHVRALMRGDLAPVGSAAGR